MEIEVHDKLLDNCIQMFESHLFRIKFIFDRKKNTMMLNLSPNIRDQIKKYNNMSKISDGGILDSLIRYLDPHDILLLFSTCKYIRIYFMDKKFSIQLDSEKLIIDMVSNKCKICKKYLQICSDEMSNKLFMLICKKLDTKIIEQFKFSFNYIENIDNYFDNCVFYALKRDTNDQIILLRYITSRFNIKNIELFKQVCLKKDVTIFMNMKNFSYSLTDKQIKIILPYICEYNVDARSFIASILNFYRNPENYIYLLDLINNNQDKYSTKILSTLLRFLILDQKINEVDTLLIAKITAKLIEKEKDIIKLIDKKVFEILFNNIKSNEIKLLLVDAAYLLKFGPDFNFLDEKLEWNLISLHYATKYNDQNVYIDKLSTIEYLNCFNNLSTNDSNVIYGLVLKSNKYKDLLNFDTLFDKAFNFIIKSIKYANSNILGYNRNIIMHLLKIPNLDIKYKILLVPLAYNNWCSKELTFLNKTKELNLLSIRMASEYSKEYHYDLEIYTESLSVREHLENFIKIDNIRVKERLLKKVVDKDVSKDIDLMQQIIDWVVNYDEHKGYKNSLTNLLAEMKYLMTNLKYPLISISYTNQNSYNLLFLDDSEELNEISIIEALKHNDEYRTIYCNKLSIDKLLKYIVIATHKNNSNIRTQLFNKIFHYKNNKINQYHIYDINYNHNQEFIYSCVNNMLPINYIYNNDSYMYEDNEVIYKYKLRLSSKLFDCEYTKLILKHEDSYYCKIFDYIVNELYINKYKINKSVDLINLLIDNNNFNKIKPSRIIALLKLYHEFNVISDKIIKNHEFFSKLL